MSCWRLVCRRGWLLRRESDGNVANDGGVVGRMDGGS